MPHVKPFRKSRPLPRKLSYESLEPRELLSAAADPAIAYTDYVPVSKFVTVPTLMVMNADGSNKTAIWSQSLSGGIIMQKSWSPDLDANTGGYQGALAVEMHYYTAPGLHICVFNITETTDTNGTPSGFSVSGPRTLVARGFNPAWSPRGDLIAFDTGATDSGIDVVRPDGSNLVNIFTPLGNGELDTGTSEPTWSPDGTQIAFKRSFRTASGTVVRGLYIQQVLDSTGQILVNGPQTTVIPEQAGFTTIEDPDWSRLGDRIAFHGSGTTLGNSIYVVQAQASGNFSAVPSTSAVYSPSGKLKVGSEALSPTWSPDDPATPADETDKFLLYTKSAQILRQELATGVVTALAQGGNLIQPDWRPFPSSGWAPASSVTATTASLATTSASPGAPSIPALDPLVVSALVNPALESHASAGTNAAASLTTQPTITDAALAAAMLQYEDQWESNKPDDKQSPAIRAVDLALAQLAS